MKIGNKIVKDPDEVAEDCMTLYKIDPVYFRPQRSCEGYVFTRVCHCIHRGSLPQCMLGYHPQEQTPPRSRHPLPWEQTPQEQTLPLGADTLPQEQTPLEQIPPGADPPLWEQTPLGADTPPGADTPWEQNPPRSRHPKDGYCWGQYASYWNAFLFL